MLDRTGVMDLLRTQHWVATVEQLHDLGVSASAVSKARHRSLVDAVAPGVVGLHEAWNAFEGRAWAAQLVGGADAFLTGQTAGRLDGLRAMSTSRIEVALPETLHRRVPPWMRLVKTSWEDDERRPLRADGLVVASPLRTLFTLAGRFDQRRFERAAEDAWHLGLVDPPTAAEYLGRIRRRGLTGVARFERWLEVATPRSAPAQTGLEQALAEILEQVALPEPERQYELELRDGRRIHLDLAWPSVRLAVEPGHTWWHGGDAAMRADQARDRACSEVGWHVVRYDESVLQRLGAAGRELRRIYEARARLVTGGIDRRPAP